MPSFLSEQLCKALSRGEQAEMGVILPPQKIFYFFLKKIGHLISELQEIVLHSIFLFSFGSKLYYLTLGLNDKHLSGSLPFIIHHFDIWE